MPLYLDGRTAILAGYGFNEAGPFIRFNDIDSGEQHLYPVMGKTFTLVRLPKRYCVGRFDLLTHERSVCPLKVELLPGEKDDMCPACQEATGFNPSFYFASTVSPQQREYNKTPHYVYLAYFSSRHIKAGISSETRGLRRLLEQGARAALIAGRFANADDARELEAALCAQPGIYETMRASTKLHLLVDEPYSADVARRTLDGRAGTLAEVTSVVAAGFAPAKGPMDFSSRYFESGKCPDVSELQLPEGHAGECAGRCVGMVGANLLMQQGSFVYATSIKEWESHVVELWENEVKVEYESVPQQASLF